MPCNRICLPPALRPADDVDQMLLDAGIIPTSMKAVLMKADGTYREEFNCNGCSDSGHSDDAGGSDDDGDGGGGKKKGKGKAKGKEKGKEKKKEKKDKKKKNKKKVQQSGPGAAAAEREIRMEKLRGDLGTWAREEYTRRDNEAGAAAAGPPLGGLGGDLGVGSGIPSAGPSRNKKKKGGRGCNPADCDTDCECSESDSTNERHHAALARARRNRDKNAGRRRGGTNISVRWETDDDDSDSDSDFDSDWSDDYRFDDYRGGGGFYRLRGRGPFYF